MSSIISMKVVSDTATPLIRAALGASKDLSKPMLSISARLKNDVLRNFRESGWFPEKWKQSSAAADGRKTLINTANLRNSFHAASGSDYASVGTDCLYAPVHQFGALISAKTSRGLRFRIGGHWITKHQVKIPARPMLPIDGSGHLHPDTDRAISQLLLKHIMGGTAK